MCHSTKTLYLVFHNFEGILNSRDVCSCVNGSLTGMEQQLLAKVHWHP